MSIIRRDLLSWAASGGTTEERMAGVRVVASLRRLEAALAEADSALTAYSQAQAGGSLPDSRRPSTSASPRSRPRRVP